MFRKWHKEFCCISRVGEMSCIDFDEIWRERAAGSGGGLPVGSEEWREWWLANWYGPNTPLREIEHRAPEFPSDFGERQRKRLSGERSQRERQQVARPFSDISDPDYKTVHLNESLFLEKLEAQGGRCLLCKGELKPLYGKGEAGLYDPERGELDMVIPKARGGESNPDNVSAAHAKCNRRKGKRLNDELDWVSR